MLHILFLFLKIIGIILLVILGIALILVGVVLFVPIRYRIKTETMNGMKKLKTEGKATWLLHLVSAHISYQDEILDGLLRVGWKTFHMNDKKEDAEDAEEAENVEEAQDAVEEKVQDKEKVSDNRASSGKTEEENSKKEGCFAKIKCTIREIYDKIKKIKEYLMEESHIQAFLRLKKELFFFIKKIKPDKIKGYLRLGYEDPYHTGQALALLSVLYPFYGENFEIYPEFEKEIIEGDIYLKGRIHLWHFLLALCRVYFDKNVKTAYYNYKSLKE